LRIASYRSFLGDALLGGRELLGLGLLLLDQLVELLEGLGAREEPAVDEERRGAAGAELRGDRLVLLDQRLERRVGQVLAPLVEVEAGDLRRVGLERLVVERLLVGEQRVVHLPELALLRRRPARPWRPGGRGRGSRAAADGTRRARPSGRSP
jgi:hypothetical protein